MGERRTLAEIVLAKDDDIADLILDGVVVFDVREITCEYVLGQVSERGLSIDATAGKVDGVFVKISAKDFDYRRARFVAKDLRDQNSERIGLFAGGTARRPDAQFGAACVRSLNQFRQDMGLERIE